jgi:hypothetical protein
VFTIGAVGAGLPNMRPVISADGTTRAVAIDSTIDAGVIPPPSVKVGDFVWLDGDHDGNQDSSESGIAGVTVTITTADGRPVRDVFGELVGPTLTDANGLYLFSNLPPGTYATHVSPDQTPLAGLRPTRTGRTDREHDSSTGSATSNDLAAGEEDLSLDYGFWRPGGGTTSRGRIPQPGQPGQPARPPTTTTAQTGVPMLQLVRLAGVLAAAGAIFLAAGYRRRWS